MKRIILTFAALLIATFAIAEFRPFVNKGGVYKQFDEKIDVVKTYVPTEDCPKGSFNYYRSCLGYLDGEVASYYSDKCDFFALNIFNNDVIFVIPKDTTKTQLTQQDVNNYLAGYKIDEMKFAQKLRDGVKDKSIRQRFVEESLGMKAQNNELKDEERGYTYIFQNGFMIDYKSHDGLNEDAKDVKVNFPQIFSRIKSNASKYYGESPTLMTEFINGQCKYFRTIEMSYLRSASNPTINYNYALLYCVFYSGVNLDDFMFFVPDAKIASSVNNYIIMSCGSYVFTFKDKVLVKM